MSSYHYFLHVLKQFRVCMKSRHNILYDKILSIPVMKNCTADIKIDTLKLKGF